MRSKRSWFLSYNSRDAAFAERLEAALRCKDPESGIFLAAKSLGAGGFWLPELANKIAEATAFVLLVGPSGLGPWQVIEYYEALDRRVKEQGFPVMLLLLGDQQAPGLPFLRQLHWITTPDLASAACVGQLMDAACGKGMSADARWHHTAPYRGLVSMEEADTDFFFGRGPETTKVISSLHVESDKLPLLLGNSGVGKSSVAQAGVLAAFMRQAWPENTGRDAPWPFGDSRRWCVLKLRPGTDPVRSLVDPFVRTWQLGATDPDRESLEAKWVENLIQGRSTLRGLLTATEDRLQEKGQAKPPAFLLYIDQGEELYVSADERQRRCFSQLIAEGLADPRLRALMSMRADFLGELHKDELLDEVSNRIEVKPLREAQLLEVVCRPPELLSARFETDHLASSLAQQAAEEAAKDAGALPLLSYLLDDMWKSKDPNWDGVLRLPAPAIDLGRVLVDRANTFLLKYPKAEDQLRRILTLKLATVRDDGEPSRRRAFRSEFSSDEWRIIGDLANHPYRLLITATTEAGETYAEVAHEAIFRRWEKLKQWIAAEREFLAWRSGLEVARRTWDAIPDAAKNDALLMGLALAQAKNWLEKRREDLPAADQDFIYHSTVRDQRRRWRLRALGGAVVAAIAVGLAAWFEHDYLSERWRYVTVIRPFAAENIWPYVLNRTREKALKPDSTNSFRECAPLQQNKDYCPDMIVVPAGPFQMGSPPGEIGRFNDESPQHLVTIAKPFAVSKYLLTFAEWDTCVDHGYCDYPARDNGWGRGRQPVIFVSWIDAQQYVKWLAAVTGKPYRLLSEAEYEFAARGGKQTVYPWGDDIKLNGVTMADCSGCGSQWDDKQPAPVGSFPPNAFGLYDMVGNVWEWVEDCYHESYIGAPADGSAWIEKGCSGRGGRGGHWNYPTNRIRSAFRGHVQLDYRDFTRGFRVGRALNGSQ